MATKTGVWNIQQVRDKQLQDLWSYVALEPGPLFSWGGNTEGQLGHNSTQAVSSPIQIPGTNWARVSGTMSGYGKEMLGLKTDNTLWAWGRGNSGGLAQNNLVSYSSPVQIPGTWSANFSCGILSSLAVRTDGTLWSWGYNGKGHLGQNNRTDYSSPVQIPGSWSTVANEGAMGGNAMNAGTCINTDGELWCWGSNTYGVLGQNNTTWYSSPVQIPGDWTNAILNKPYQQFSVIKSNGTLWTWGRENKGSLGHNEGEVFKSSPTQVGSDTNWRKIVSGNYGSVATKTDGTLWYMGGNGFGAAGLNQPMGPGGLGSRSSPTQITSGTDWNDIAVSMWTRYASKTDGTLYGWGRGDGGSLFTPGVGNANRSSPTQLQGGATDFTGSLSACYDRSLFNVRN